MDDWSRFSSRYMSLDGTGLTLDFSDMPRTGFDDGLASIVPALEGALRFMEELEAGGLANPDEGRQVGHYWLRSPGLAPDPSVAQAITAAAAEARRLGEHLPLTVGADTVLHLGIGGSALGPELLRDALGGSGPISPERYLVLDNTDPDGFHGALQGLDPRRALVLVVSKSGGTAETRNAMLRVRAHFRGAGVDFAERAVAITGEDSGLHRLAMEERWAGVLPLWDWVGGRTSVTGPVGLLPAALLGINGERFLRGAAEMDRHTRAPVHRNPACLLAASWYLARRERPRMMVVLPYSDRLQQLARYLQQLVMESIGKRLDRSGHEVREGLTVLGNKGSTDQHAFVQQLRDGPDDFFVTFVQLLRASTPDPEVEGGFTAGDFLHGFLLGTRQALRADGKQSLTLALDALEPLTLGALVALFERTVGVYAELMDINAYHQPGVEAGKKAAAEALEAQRALLEGLDHEARSAPELARMSGAGDPVLAFRLLWRLAQAGDRGVLGEGGPAPAQVRFRRG